MISYKKILELITCFTISSYACGMNITQISSKLNQLTAKIFQLNSSIKTISLQNYLQVLDDQQNKIAVYIKQTKNNPQSITRDLAMQLANSSIETLIDLKALSPYIKKNTFTPEEKNLLINSLKKYNEIIQNFFEETKIAFPQEDISTLVNAYDYFYMAIEAILTENFTELFQVITTIQKTWKEFFNKLEKTTDIEASKKTIKRLALFAVEIIGRIYLWIELPHYMTDKKFSIRFRALLIQMKADIEKIFTKKIVQENTLEYRVLQSSQKSLEFLISPLD